METNESQEGSYKTSGTTTSEEFSLFTAELIVLECKSRTAGCHFTSAIDEVTENEIYT